MDCCFNTTSLITIVQDEAHLIKNTSHFGATLVHFIGQKPEVRL